MKNKTNPIIYVILAVGTLIAGFLICVGVLLIVRQPSSAPITPKSVTLDLAKGTFTIPGEAYIDGRDLEAKPILTIKNINIWNKAESPRSKVCSIIHGENIDLLDYQYDSELDLYSFKVRKGDCEGWVDEGFISVEQEVSVGETIP